MTETDEVMPIVSTLSPSLNAISSSLSPSSAVTSPQASTATPIESAEERQAREEADRAAREARARALKEQLFSDGEGDRSLFPSSSSAAGTLGKNSAAKAVNIFADEDPDDDFAASLAARTAKNTPKANQAKLDALFADA